MFFDVLLWIFFYNKGVCMISFFFYKMRGVDLKFDLGRWIMVVIYLFTVVIFFGGRLDFLIYFFF